MELERGGLSGIGRAFGFGAFERRPRAGEPVDEYLDEVGECEYAVDANRETDDAEKRVATACHDQTWARWMLDAVATVCGWTSTEGMSIKDTRCCLLFDVDCWGLQIQIGT